MTTFIHSSNIHSTDKHKCATIMEYNIPLVIKINDHVQ